MSGLGSDVLSLAASGGPAVLVVAVATGPPPAVKWSGAVEIM